MELCVEKFDEAYFERGKEAKVSCYENYHWIPELTIPMAKSIIDWLKLGPDDKVLDFGCAKGYLVKALRICGIDAEGCDISRYATTNCDKEIKDHIHYTPEWECKQDYTYIITKDVLEHLTLSQIEEFLWESTAYTKRMFHVIPLGNGKKFTVPEYDLDRTHITARPVEWWVNLFSAFNWKLIDFHYDVPGVKDNWTTKYPKGNGFFTLERKSIGEDKGL